MRLIIYTGKGGVGKTSVSAATARLLAKKGYRTIIMSTDSAHSLSDSLGITLPNDIQNVEENLDALEIDIIHEMRTRWADISHYISALMISQGMGEITAEEMAIIPGMEMVAALFYVLSFEEEDRYDVVVMDTPPTGETLRLLSFPDMSNWYIDKVYALMKRFIGLARVTVGKFMDFPLPDKAVMNSIEEMKNRMNKVKAVLENPQKTTVRLVLNPERMVISETMRAYTYICLYNKNVECLIVNKIYPKEDLSDSDFFREKLKEQDKHLRQIDDAFSELKIMNAYQMSTELVGPEKLDLMAEMIFGDSDPIEVYANESPMRFLTVDDIDEMRLKMPFVKKSSIELFKGESGTLVVHVGSQKRTVSLPATLMDAEVLGAELSDEELIVKLKRQNANTKDRRKV
ncbi:MAG: ArsA family ATPase [Candidatus Methanomethylophilaceae archaeon]|jgi:arsenite-transporting ATPase|nr:ArsA family ATPase [Candidatus Methanomethylophilaceae archaeon]